MSIILHVHTISQSTITWRWARFFPPCPQCHLVDLVKYCPSSSTTTEVPPQMTSHVSHTSARVSICVCRSLSATYTKNLTHFLFHTFTLAQIQYASTSCPLHSPQGCRAKTNSSLDSWVHKQNLFSTAPRPLDVIPYLVRGDNIVVVAQMGHVF